MQAIQSKIRQGMTGNLETGIKRAKNQQSDARNNTMII